MAVHCGLELQHAPSILTEKRFTRTGTFRFTDVFTSIRMEVLLSGKGGFWVCLNWLSILSNPLRTSLGFHRVLSSVRFKCVQQWKTGCWCRGRKTALKTRKLRGRCCTQIVAGCTLTASQAYTAMSSNWISRVFFRASLQPATSQLKRSIARAVKPKRLQNQLPSSPFTLMQQNGSSLNGMFDAISEQVCSPFLQHMRCQCRV